MTRNDQRISTAAGHSDLASLKRASILGIATNSFAQMLKFAIQFGYQIWIMRLLDPLDFGLVAMAAPVLAFVQLFSDFGLSQAVVQSPSISQEQSSYLFWFNVSAGVVVTVITMALSPVAGWFYHEPRVTNIVLALGSLLMFGALQAQHVALLNRRMEYSKLATTNVVSLAFGCMCGVIAARAGLGYWALIVNQAAASISSLLLVAIFLRWTPDFPNRRANVRGLLGFGGNVMGFNLVNFFHRNLDNVLIGRVWGGDALGLYDRAYKLLLFPLTQILTPFAAVALPMLARTRENHVGYKRGYLRLLQSILVLTYPGVIFALCTTDSLIDSVFGSRWAGVAPIFSVLGLAALYSPISNTTGWLFISQDRTQELRNYGVLSSLAFVVSFVLGLHWGPLGVAICYVSVGAVQAPILCWAATRKGPVNFKDLRRALFPVMVAGAISAGAILALQNTASRASHSLVTLLVVSYLVFSLGLCLTREGRRWVGDCATEMSRLSGRLQR